MGFTSKLRHSFFFGIISTMRIRHSTDNGSEFKNPWVIEDLYGEKRTKVFYCDPQASWQKGRLEKNHEFIRYVLPKGKNLQTFTQSDMIKLMNHINSSQDHILS